MVGAWAAGARAEGTRERGACAAGRRARGAHGAQALCVRPCTAWAWPGRWMGVLAGPAELVLVHSAPSSVFGTGLTRF